MGLIVGCPKGMQAEGLEPPKSPEGRAYLLLLVEAELDDPHWDGPTTQFVSCFYCQLGMAQADDLIRKCILADLKASGGEHHQTARLLPSYTQAAPAARREPRQGPDGGVQD